jgi:hypothetical protein
MLVWRLHRAGQKAAVPYKRDQLSRILEAKGRLTPVLRCYCFRHIQRDVLTSIVICGVLVQKIRILISVSPVALHPVSRSWPLLFLGVSKQFGFYKVGSSVPPLTHSNPTAPMGCFFVWFLTENLPSMGGRISSHVTGSTACCINEKHKTHQHSSRSYNSMAEES